MRKKIIVQKGNRFFRVKDGALYTRNIKRLLLYPNRCKKNKTFSMPKEVCRVDDVAFDGNSYIEKLVVNSDIYDSQDEGGSCVNMKNLKNVIFKVKQTYDDGLCFANCKKLEKVVLAEGTKSIGYKQFAGCSNLTTINFPDSLEAIADNAFEGCDKLVLPEFDESKIRHIDY